MGKFRYLCKKIFYSEQYKKGKVAEELWKKEEYNKILNNPVTKQITFSLFEDEKTPCLIHITSSGILAKYEDFTDKHIFFASFSIKNLGIIQKRFLISPNQFGRDHESTCHFDQIFAFAKIMQNKFPIYSIEVDPGEGYRDTYYYLVKAGYNKNYFEKRAW